MKIKSRPGDFRVEERLREGYVQARGPHRVYRVTKRKLTSLEAAEEVATLLGVAPSDVSLAGLKDRQGVTVQYMSVPRGKPLRVNESELRVETVGSAEEPLTADDSEGNRFVITVRDLGPREIAKAESAARIVRTQGVPNYFDDQRFGNLRHNQGWIARDLCQGRAEEALKRLLTASSHRDDRGTGKYKALLRSHWGQWSTCREISARYGRNHTLFRHLSRKKDDFEGAFRFVASRLRLIHLYAFQSHLWNRAVARYVFELADPAGRITVSSVEGPLVFQGKDTDIASAPATFRLPGPGLEDVEDPTQKRLLTEALNAERLRPEQYRIDGVPGFAIKGEDRQLFVRPERFDLRAPRSERGAATGKLLISFDLPRGSYATLVLRRLFERPLDGPERYNPERSSGPGRGSSGGGRRGGDGRDKTHRGRRNDGRRSAGRRDRGLGALRHRGSE